MSAVHSKHVESHLGVAVQMGRDFLWLLAKTWMRRKAINHIHSRRRFVPDCEYLKMGLGPGEGFGIFCGGHGAVILRRRDCLRDRDNES